MCLCASIETKNEVEMKLIGLFHLINAIEYFGKDGKIEKTVVRSKLPSLGFNLFIYYFTCKNLNFN